VQHYGKNTVSDFGPLSLVFLRDKWVESGKARKSINRYTAIIRQAVKWGVSRELVPAAVWHALQSVENLKAGRTSAKEYRIIQPINEETVLKTIPFMPPIIADMVRIQLLIGGRPQDVCNMRSCDIDRSEDVWRYRPFRHKTKYKSKTAERAVGPKAQAVLAPYLERKAYTPEAFLFSPQDTVKLQKEEKRRKRKTKVQPSQINRSKPNPSRPPKENYTKDGYGRAVRRACVKAGVEIWSPNRLRHSAGSKVREKYGLEYAQAVLGHANAKTTEIYAEVSFGKAAKVAREMG
jgi:integrase